MSKLGLQEVKSAYYTHNDFRFKPTKAIDGFRDVCKNSSVEIPGRTPRPKPVGSSSRYVPTLISGYTPITPFATLSPVKKTTHVKGKGKGKVKPGKR